MRRTPKIAGGGTANLAAGFTGSLVTGNSPSRSAAMDASGAKSQLPSLVAAGTITVVMLFFTDVLAFLPNAALAGIVANAALFLDEIEQLIARPSTPVRWFVLDAEAMVDVDTTGAEVLRQAITMIAKRDVTFAVSRADRAFRAWLEKYELMELIDQSRFYPTNRDAAAAFREDPE